MRYYDDMPLYNGVIRGLDGKGLVMDKEQVKRISPELAASPKWGEYVEWFWGKKGFEDYTSIALGYDAGIRND